MVVIFKP